MSIHTKILKKESLSQMADSPIHASHSSPFSHLYGQGLQKAPSAAGTDEDARYETERLSHKSYNFSTQSRHSARDPQLERSGSRCSPEQEHEAAPKPKLNAQTLFSFSVSSSCFQTYVG